MPTIGLACRTTVGSLLRDAVVTAHPCKGTALRTLDQFMEFAAAFEEVMERSPELPAPLALEAAAPAFRGKGEHYN